MYTESSNGEYGSTSTMTSSYANVHVTYCLRFMYHMFGAHIGKLVVIILIDDKYPKRYLTLEGEQGNQWLEEYIEIPPMSTGEVFQVQFVAKRGIGFAGDIAIDDVSLKEGACSMGK